MPHSDVALVRSPRLTSSYGVWDSVSRQASHPFSRADYTALLKARTSASPKELERRVREAETMARGVERRGTATVRFDGRSTVIDSVERARRTEGGVWQPTGGRHVDFSDGRTSANFQIDRERTPPTTPLDRMVFKWSATMTTNGYAFEHTVGTIPAPILFAGGGAGLVFTAGQIKRRTARETVFERILPPTESFPVRHFQRLTVSRADGRPLRWETGPLTSPLTGPLTGKRKTSTAKASTVIELSDYRTKGLVVPIAGKVTMRSFGLLGDEYGRTVYTLREMVQNRPALVGDLGVLTRGRKPGTSEASTLQTTPTAPTPANPPLAGPWLLGTATLLVALGVGRAAATWSVA